MRFLTEHPLIQILQPAERILLAGMGGGFDVYCAMPLYWALKHTGREVFLASLSSATLRGVGLKRLDYDLYEVGATVPSALPYFPELKLAQWLQKHDDRCPVYCVQKTGVRGVARAYRTLAERLQIDTVILVDGGTDSLLRGDEAGVGTPAEDITSIAAIDQLEVPRKLLVSLGFGVDAFHGVCHAYVLETMADLAQHGDFLGAWSLTKEMPEAALYLKLVEYASQQMPHMESIVNNSVASAIEGYFGNYHATRRTDGSELFINPLMSIYWAFQLEGIVRRNLYIDRIRETETIYDVIDQINAFRTALPSWREWKALPM